MVQHWLTTPVDSILGTGYGNNLPDYLHRPLGEMRLGEWVDKMYRDLPVLGFLPEEAVQVSFDSNGLEISRVTVAVLSVPLNAYDGGG